jgi:hypothetical protein
MLEELDGVKFPLAINGQHLKKYYPACGTMDTKQPMAHIRLTASISRSISPACGMMDSKQQMAEKGANMWNQPRKNNIYIYIIANEQPSTLGVPNFKNYWVTEVHRGNYKAFY